jgi:hypothetical protein
MVGAAQPSPGRLTILTLSQATHAAAWRPARLQCYHPASNAASEPVSGRTSSTVSYPRACPVCAVNYGATGATDRGHVTLRSDPGGTPSPWRPKQPGRILTLKCMTCSDDFVWDYFGSSTLQHHGGNGRVDDLQFR